MYTESEFENLIKSVETEFSAHLAEVQKNFTLGADGSLAKSEDGGKKPPEKKEAGKEKPPGEAKPEGEKAPSEGKEAAPAAADAPAAPAAEGAPAAAPAEAQATPAQAAGAAGEGTCDYDAEDLAHMEKMYLTMSPGELKAHHDCIAKIAKCGGGAEAAPPAGPAGAPAPMAEQGVQKSELNAHGEKENPPQPTVKGANLDSDPKNGGIEGQEPANALGPKSPASKAAGVQMGKSEHARRNGGKIEDQAPANSPGAKSPASKAEGVQMHKSENAEVELAKAETAAANAKVETLQKSLDAVSAILTKMVERKVAPAGKAITSLDVVAKSEGSQEDKSLTKGEIDSKLLMKAQDPKLEKSDRDLINNFYLNSGSLNSISHLLK